MKWKQGTILCSGSDLVCQYLSNWEKNWGNVGETSGTHQRLDQKYSQVKSDNKWNKY